MEIYLMMRNRKWMLLLCMSLIVTVRAAEVQTDNEMSAPAVLVMESPYSFEETVDNLRDAIGEHNFRMIREQPWDYGLESGVRIGQLLPFRVTIMEQGDRVLVMAVNPEVLGQVMDNPQLGRFRTHVASVYREIIEDGLF
jgi:uncharacterized protein (DUF302 family)